MSNSINAGYVRLSRDDDRQHCASIENQKLIITQYAAEHNLTIHRWYEDDGISGYLFDRPGFNQMMADLDQDIHTVFVKDFSRLGRHNAKILLLLDEFQELGRHLVVIDDHYDSEKSEDDMIGITTWFNERYVKDTSRKIRRALEAKQKAGTLPTQPPFGYQKTEKSGEPFAIIPEEAQVIQMIYKLYLQGLGYRKIAQSLTEQGILTPSMTRKKRQAHKKTPNNSQAAFQWSEHMIKAILDNDFYIGTLRLQKRKRQTIHGKDKRVPKDQQYIFENHHPPIISQTIFNQVQQQKKRRIRSNYPISQPPEKRPQPPSFYGCLFCKDCGHRLTPASRSASFKIYQYYICSTYNAKGKTYCPKSHLTKEEDLLADMTCYLKACRNTLRQALMDIHTLSDRSSIIQEMETDALIHEKIAQAKKQLSVLLSQKLRDISANPDDEKLISESYDQIRQDLTAHIHALETRLEESQTKVAVTLTEEEPKNALNRLDDLIQKNTLNRHDMEILTRQIVIDKKGMPEIWLNCSFSSLNHRRMIQELNRQEHEVILAVLDFIKIKGQAAIFSPGGLSAALTLAGYPKNQRSVQPYLQMMAELGVIIYLDHSQKSCQIIKEGEALKQLRAFFTIPAD